MAKQKKRGFNCKKCIIMGIILIIAVGLGSFLPMEGLTEASRISLVIFLIAAGFWITEVVTPSATALLVIALHVFILGRENGPLDLGRSGYKEFLEPAASPILVLFFGGFVLARAAKKHHLDMRLAKMIIKPFGKRPQFILLGIILTTAVFSMFMSNTATTAMMITIFGPLFAHGDKREIFKKALVLAIPFAANIGGIGTIIGTPPNAVAVSYLFESLDYKITFLKWMVLGVPLAAILLFFLWVILLLVFKPKVKTIEIEFGPLRPISRDMIIVMVCFSITIFLWMTEVLHGINSGVVALFPVVIFKLSGVIDVDDLKNLEWDVLFLMAGGLVLGSGMKTTGLSDVLVAQISVISSNPKAILGLMIVFSFLLANFMSHTSAANLIVPIVASIAVLSPKLGVVAVALTTSLAQSLPISTPPNAIAYSTRIIGTKDMVKYGTLLSVIGLGVMVLFLYLYRNFI